MLGRAEKPEDARSSRPLPLDPDRLRKGAVTGHKIRTTKTDQPQHVLGDNLIFRQSQKTQLRGTHRLRIPHCALDRFESQISDFGPRASSIIQNSPAYRSAQSSI